MHSPRARATAAPCAASLADLDPQLAWYWLSLSAAEATRGQLVQRVSDGRVDGRANWLQMGLQLDPRRLACLQQSADRNRALATTSVRQDLLLHEWLLEWAGQPLARAG